jgi:ribose-phosphate pyrophosphokinase
VKTINLNTHEGLEVILFPDGQPHIKIIKPIYENDEVEVVASLTNSNKVIQLLEISEKLDRIGCSKYLLKIPYLMGARYDRVMDPEGSFDLKVIANLINSMHFKHVNILDPHSDVSLALINNSIEFTNWSLVSKYTRPNSVLIIPDTGAAKKAERYLEWNTNIVDSVQCIKHRDLSTGHITLKVLEPEKTIDRNCVIIDDICDGGATFNLIAEQLPATLSKTLIVTHGIFSKGLRKLEENFDEIISSTSFEEGVEGNKLKRYNLM